MTAGWTAHYLDGRTALRHRVALDLGTTGVVITLDSGETVRWPLGDIRQTQGRHAGEQVRLERRGGAHDALLVDDPALLAALRRAGSRGHGRFHGARRRRRVVLTALAALGVVPLAAALLLWGIPTAAAALATYVPPSWEARLGAAVVAHAIPPGRRCVDSVGEAALGEILDRLLAPIAPTPYRFHLTVVDDGRMNAFAAPGGHIVLLRGLLERTRTPEELAGVLAHETQHVLRHHSTRAWLQQASLGLLLTAVAGEGLAGARDLGVLHYGRGAEEEADIEGVKMLLAAGIDPRGMVAFFDSVRQSEQRDGNVGLSVYLRSHPSSEDRWLAVSRLALEAPARPRPLLAGRDWTAVTRMCR